MFRPIATAARGRDPANPWSVRIPAELRGHVRRNPQSDRSPRDALSKAAQGRGGQETRGPACGRAVLASPELGMPPLGIKRLLRKTFRALRAASLAKTLPPRSFDTEPPAECGGAQAVAAGAATRLDGDAHPAPAGADGPSTEGRLP